METKQPPCSICGQPIDVQVFPRGQTWAEGHNAEPINSGRCCTKCNAEVVIPARLRRSFFSRKGK